MSHITDVKMRVRDLDCLAEAAKECGFELRRNKTNFAWWGRFVGDSDDYGELDPKDFGKCAHAMGRIGTTPSDGPMGEWEIAVVKAKDGDGFVIGADLFGAPGQRLLALAGDHFNKLKHAYSRALAVKKAKAMLALKGFTLDRPRDLGNGRAVVRAWRL